MSNTIKMIIADKMKTSVLFLKNEFSFDTLSVIDTHSAFVLSISRVVFSEMSFESAVTHSPAFTSISLPENKDL